MKINLKAPICDLKKEAFLDEEGKILTLQNAIIFCLTVTIPDATGRPIPIEGTKSFKLYRLANRILDYPDDEIDLEREDVDLIIERIGQAYVRIELVGAIYTLLGV